MPYIRQDLKDGLDRGYATAATPGELAYVLTREAERYRAQQPGGFLTLCIIMGVFICAMLEFYRRVVGPYEDTKRAENGDVY